jgi:hypothetical protein
MSWRILARSASGSIRAEQQEQGHGAPRNTDARLDRATVSPGLELAGLSTLQPDRLIWGASPSAPARRPVLLRSAPWRSGPWLAGVRFGTQADRAHLSHCSDDREELDPLPFIRHGDQLLPVAAPARKSSDAVQWPADQTQGGVPIAPHRGTHGRNPAARTFELGRGGGIRQARSAALGRRHNRRADIAMPGL